MLAKSDIQREALNLPAQERIQLVVELWDSLAPGEIPVPDWQRDLVRDRLAALENVLPEERSVPWDARRKRVFSNKAGPGFALALLAPVLVRVLRAGISWWAFRISCERQRGRCDRGGFGADPPEAFSRAGRADDGGGLGRAI